MTSYHADYKLFAKDYKYNQSSLCSPVVVYWPKNLWHSHDAFYFGISYTDTALQDLIKVGLDKNISENSIADISCSISQYICKFLNVSKVGAA